MVPVFEDGLGHIEPQQAVRLASSTKIADALARALVFEVDKHVSKCHM